MTGEKRHPATERRRQQARADGRVAKSHDLTSSALLVVAIVSLWLFGGYLSLNLMSWLSDSLNSVSFVAFQQDVWREKLLVGVAKYSLFISPLLGVMFFSVVFINLSQTGLVLSPSRVQPDLQKLSLVAGLRRIVSIDGLVRLGLGCLKMFLGVGVSLFVINQNVEGLTGISRLPITEIGSSLFEFIANVCIQVALALFILGVLDYGFQRWKFERDIMMTDQELREELKETESGVEVTRRRRGQMQQGAAEKQSVNVLPQSEMVLESAANLAVSMSFSNEQPMSVRVLQKGFGRMAGDLRSRALERGVVVAKQTTLANAIHALVEEGDLVPPQHHKELLALLKTGEPV